MRLDVNPLSLLAAEIRGLDCATPLAPELVQAANQAWLDYPVLLIRDQLLSAPELAAFGRQFGRLESYGSSARAAKKGLATNSAARLPLSALRQQGGRTTPDQILYLHPDDPDVLIMSNERRSDQAIVGIVDNAETWHADASHRPEPCRAIILHATRNPTAGGDTEFCDMRSVYDALAPQLKAELTNRTATHHWSKSRNLRFAGLLGPAAEAEGRRIAALVPDMHQPVVRTHRGSGRQSLFLSPRFTICIDGLPSARSEELLNEIFAFAETPRFCYRHQWRENDIVIWDNSCLNHRVHSYLSDDIRCRHRVTIAGERPL